MAYQLTGNDTMTTNSWELTANQQTISTSLTDLKLQFTDICCGTRRFRWKQSLRELLGWDASAVCSASNKRTTCKTMVSRTVCFGAVCPNTFSFLTHTLYISHMVVVMANEKKRQSGDSKNFKQIAAPNPASALQIVVAIWNLTLLPELS